jgi:hypothetical protein
MLAALCAVAAPAVARAEGLSATIEPGFTHTETDLTTPGPGPGSPSRTTHQTVDQFLQRYRLGLDRSITDRLTASLGGTFLDDRTWAETDGVSSPVGGSRATSLYARLTLGAPTLTLGVGADRNEQTFRSASGTSFVTENFTAFGNWRPVDLPELDLRVNRFNVYDTLRRTQDATTDSALLGVRYEGRTLGARYLVTWTRSSDHLNLVDSTSVDQTVLGTWSDSLFARRTSAYASASFVNRNATTTSLGQNGTVTRQQSPIGGLSGIVALPATEDNIALAPNPALVDGNTGAAAGVDVGFGPSAAGDRNPRDVAGRFADVVTPVNTFYVWFDRAITPEVGVALARDVAVFRSDDNQRWTRVDVVGTPVVSPFANRIEITTPQVQARFLKVALVPLAVGVTVDAAYRALFVSEVQFLLVLPASLVPRSDTTYTAAGNFLARTAIVRDPDLAYDLQAQVTYQSAGELTTYTLVNGLSFATRLTASLGANARGERQDRDAGQGHEGLWLWNASLVGNPFPTAYWNLTYSGSSNDRDRSLTHSLTALGRADLYEGISTQANAVASIFTQGERTSQTGQAGGTLSLTPNRFVTLTGGVLYSRSLTSSPDTGDVVTEFGRLDGTVSLTPAPALSAAGTLSRLFGGVRPTTLATLQLNYYPLRGELQLNFFYTKTLDTAADATTETYGPTLRWNVRRNVSLTASYTVVRNTAPVQTLSSRVAATSLLITL